MRDIGDLRLDAAHVDEQRADRDRPDRDVGHRRGRRADAVDLRSRFRSRHQRDHQRARRRAARRRGEPGQRADRRRPTRSCSRTRRSKPTRPRCSRPRARSRRPTRVAGAHRDVVEPERGDGLGRHRHVDRQPHVHRRRARRPPAASAPRNVFTSTAAPVAAERRDPARDRRPGARLLDASRPTTSLSIGQPHDHGDAGVGRRDQGRRHRARRIDHDRRHQRHAAAEHRRQPGDADARARHVQRRRNSRPRCRPRPRRAGAPVTASVDANTGALQLATTEEGSAATLQVTGGNALGALNLSTDGAALTGTDGKVQVDGGAIQTVTDIVAGQTITLNAPTGTISAVFSGGLRTGTLTASNISTGDGSLGTVVGNINSRERRRDRERGAGRHQPVPPAAHVDHDRRAPRPQHRRLRLQREHRRARLGHDRRRRAAHDRYRARRVHRDVGVERRVGPAARRDAHPRRHSPGTRARSPSRPRTTPRASPTKVQALVDAANALHQTIASVTAYDPTTNTAQPLTGDFATTQLANSLATALEDAVARLEPREPRTWPASPSDQNGDVQRSTSRRSSPRTTPTRRAWRSCSRRADRRRTRTSRSSRPPTPRRAARYDVNVTQAATHATSTGLNGTWPTGADSTIAVSIGTNQITVRGQGRPTRRPTSSPVSTPRSRTPGSRSARRPTAPASRSTRSATATTSTFDVAWDGTNFSTVRRHRRRRARSTASPRPATASS